jgi:hypothetical protein
MKQFAPDNLKTTVEISVNRVSIGLFLAQECFTTSINFKTECNPLGFADVVEKLISIRNDQDLYWNNTELYLEDHSVDRKIYFVQKGCVLTIFTRYKNLFANDPNLLAEVPDLIRKKLSNSIR